MNAPTSRTVAEPSFSIGEPATLLVGRAREQRVLHEELDIATGGRGRLVLIGGEAGIGKTTLARDLIETAEERGVRVLAGHCYDLTNTPPYGPWLDLFETCQRHPDLPPPPFAGGQSPRVTDRSALFADVRRFVDAVTSSRPALVLLEDLHWADPASVELLRHLGPHLQHWPALLIVTYRADELDPNRPFAQQLPSLIREANARRLDLRRLDADALDALVNARSQLARADADRLVAYLERHAEGNPFFTTELLRTLEEESLLRRANQGWTLATLDRVVIPPLLRQVIDGRIARLGEATRRSLAIAAVIGQDVPLGLWGEVANLAEETLLDITEQAVDAHLLEATRAGTHIRFVHALTRAALYEGILPPRRRTWHRGVAETLIARSAADPDAVAFHFQQAGDPRAAEWLIRAGDRAQRAYAWLTAAERLRAAVSLLDGIEGEERRCCRLACRIGYLKRFSDPAGAIADVEAAERVAARIGDAVIAIELRWSRGVLLGYSDRLRASRAVMKTSLDAFEAAPAEDTRATEALLSWFSFGLPAVDLVDPSDDERAIARLHAAGLQFHRSVFHWYCCLAGELDSAVDIAERIAGQIDVPGSWGHMPAIAAFIYQALGIAQAALGRPDEAETAWTRSRELFAAYDHQAVIAFTLLDALRMVTLTFRASNPAARRDFAAEAEAALGRAGGSFRPGVSPRLAWLGCLALDGRWDEALRILDNLPPPGNSYLRREVTSTRALLARHRGEPAIAWEQIRPLFPNGPATEPGDIIHEEGLFLQRLAAELCLDAGDASGARAWLSAHDRWLAWSGSILGRADGFLGWAKYSRATRDAERARASATEALTAATMPDQPLVLLAAHRLLGEIESEVGRFRQADEHLTISLDLADRCEVPFERALTLLATAELHLAEHREADATRLLDDVRRICHPLGAAPTLTRVELLAARLTSKSAGEAHSAGLTARELDVLRLLVTGRSNPEIAEALYISRDTARTHVANIFRKLDVNSRAEAVDRAHRHGLISPSTAPST